MTLRAASRALLAYIILASAAGLAHAEALVLIQGYLGSASDWRHSGVTAALEKAGWRDGGDLRLYPGHPRPRGAAATKGRRYYTIGLPTEAPLLHQAGYLERYLGFIQERSGGGDLVLVGHSAGGVLARLYMVQHPEAGVSGLITIASPHLGTDAAELGLMASDSPLGWIAPMLGIDTLQRSRALYQDLSRENPSTVLFWLNRQPHPDSYYASIVRAGDGDMVVPEWSQDLNHVPALQGRARTVLTNKDHALGPEDGRLLVVLLKEMRSL